MFFFFCCEGLFISDSNGLDVVFGRKEKNQEKEEMRRHPYESRLQTPSPVPSEVSSPSVTPSVASVGGPTLELQPHPETIPMLTTPVPVTTTQQVETTTVESKGFLSQLYENEILRYVFIALLIIGILFLMYWMFSGHGHPTTSTSNPSGTTAGGRTVPFGPVGPPGGGGYPSPPSQPGRTNVTTPYGLLNGNLLSDTHIILPIGSVVTIYSPFSKGFLRMVNEKEAQGSTDTVAAGGAVIQANGRSGSDLECQWVVKAPYRYKGAVRLDNAAYDALYWSEMIPKSGNKVLIMPGVGIEWSDVLVTTLNFVDQKFSQNTDTVVMIGVETALLNDVEHIVGQTHFLMGTTAEGILPDTSNVVAGPNSAWQIRIVGSVNNGKITYQ